MCEGVGGRDWATVCGNRRTFPAEQFTHAVCVCGINVDVTNKLNADKIRFQPSSLFRAGKTSHHPSRSGQSLNTLGS